MEMWKCVKKPKHPASVFKEHHKLFDWASVEFQESGRTGDNSGVVRLTSCPVCVSPGSAGYIRSGQVDKTGGSHGVGKLQIHRGAAGTTAGRRGKIDGIESWEEEGGQNTNSENFKSKYKEKCNMQQQLSVSTSCDITIDTYVDIYCVFIVL